MKNILLSKKLLAVSYLFFMLIGSTIFAQVGIGTVTPDASSILDISSTTQGMLAPRLTTAQRIAIASPANGLMVFDTDLKSFYYYISTTTTWTQLSSDANGRTNFKRIKAASDLATELSNGGGTKYLLTSNTYYEINGTIVLSFPIDLNEAYISGLDANEDKLVRFSGNLFDGSKGGTVRNVTIVVSGGGKVFNLTGSSGPTDNLLLRDTVIANCSDVGTITNFSLVFVSVVQYVGNTTGIVYTNISSLLLNNTAWFSTNAGTFEKLVGNFGLVQKLGGFMEVTGAAIGFDVFANPTITNDGVLESVVFSGTPTTGKYVNPYTVGIYTGYNFNNRWNVRCAGIPTETDLTAVGNINFNHTLGSPATTGVTTTATKLTGVTTSEDLFRFSMSGNNRIVYLGTKKRFFRVGGFISFQTADNNITLIFYIAKNGVILPKSKVYVKSNNNTDVIAIPIQTLVELSTNEYLELFVATTSGTGDVKIVSVNLSAS
ncbi:MAG: hypothetical protein H7Y10_13140 [Flavobacterium sp.]|nr:hypothetical protein [Flavobacterium sp.]